MEKPKTLSNNIEANENKSIDDILEFVVVHCIHTCENLKQ
jgi:hypothetical protein